VPGQVNPEDAIASFRQAVGFLTELGKLKQIGKIHQQIAEVGVTRVETPYFPLTPAAPLQIYEREGNYDEAIENYTQAADYFSNDGVKTSAGDCLRKTAVLLTTQRGDAEPSTDNYGRAARIFEDVGGAGQ
jgi:tetratricopeptide (TPR) repeat protein